MAAMKVLEFAVAILGGAILGGSGIYVGYRLGQTPWGRRKSETIQTLFSRHIFK